MSWLYSLATSLPGPLVSLSSKARWINHNQHFIEEGTMDFYKMALMLNEYSRFDKSNSTTFILELPNLDDSNVEYDTEPIIRVSELKNENIKKRQRMQATIPHYFRWEVDNPVKDEVDIFGEKKLKRTFHVWLEQEGIKKKFIIYAKMDNSIRICKEKLDERYTFITTDPIPI